MRHGNALWIIMKGKTQKTIIIIPSRNNYCIPTWRVRTLRFRLKQG